MSQRKKNRGKTAVVHTMRSGVVFTPWGRENSTHLLFRAIFCQTQEQCKLGSHCSWLVQFLDSFRMEFSAKQQRLKQSDTFHKLTLPHLPLPIWSLSGSHLQTQTQIENLNLAVWVLLGSWELQRFLENIPSPCLQLGEAWCVQENWHRWEPFPWINWAMMARARSCVLAWNRVSVNFQGQWRPSSSHKSPKYKDNPWFRHWKLNDFERIMFESRGPHSSAPLRAAVYESLISLQSFSSP